ncbi:DUF1549 domain-containing protein [Stieleria varia]|uniref:Planctomycete cytochrome C n=1 Tax=Stieleria varia TaxID=2528005 RepID=A0A5C6AY05_9BACT|nr:DUF1549 domain-containing protein [Stieleria varia]TWU04905.1 Planctomycete cytochrome C [Stieleria varia]
MFALNAHRRLLCKSLVFGLALCLANVSRADQSPEDAPKDLAADSAKVSYHDDVLPIFRRQCLGCHQGAKQQGEYLMTDFAALLAGGESTKAAIVPGKPSESYLLDRIKVVDGVAEMPEPPAKPLSEPEIETITRWIEQGAVNDSPQSDGPAFSSDNPPVYNAPAATTSIDVSADGMWLAVAGYHEVLLIDIASGKLAHRLVGMSPRINSVRFSPDGKRLAAVGGTPAVAGEVQIWEVESAELSLSTPYTYDALCGADWSPDGKMLAFGASDNVVRAIDSTTGLQVLFQGAHDDWVRDVGFTKDGKHVISVARDMSCKLTEVETERFIDNITSITPGALSGGLNSVDVHHERDEIVVGGADGVAKVYRVFRETARKIGDDANLIRSLPKLSGRISSVTISPDASRIAAVATLDGKSEAQVWKYDFSGKLENEIKSILAKRVADRSAAENEKVTAYRGGEVETLAKVTIADAAAYAICVSSNNEFFVACGDGTVRHYSPTGDLVKSISSLPSKVASVAVAHPRFDPNQWQDALPEVGSTPKPDASTINGISVYPESVELDSPYAYCQLIVTATTEAGDRIDVTRDCQFQAPQWLSVNAAGLIRPSGNGSGEITVQFGSHQQKIVSAATNVSDAGPETGAVDFVRDVNPILSRLGCNQGTCHGAQKGKAGFKLSLRGYDPIFDLRALTDDLAARRINPAAPEHSLMLRKPLGLTPHEGGSLMVQGDPYHAVLQRWIADGSQLNLETPRVSQLEIFPINPVVQTIGMQQQVRLIAHYADGTKRDVTREAFIDSGNSEVATAAKGGLLTSVRRGEAPILARYEGKYAATTLTVMGDRSGFAQSDVETWSPIDELVAAKWDRVKVSPSPLCDDATFLRRVYLDLTGMPPTSQNVREFLADETPTRAKREKVVDALLASEEYVDFWTNKWADLLQVNRKFLGVEGSTKFRDWIRAAVAENRPYDQFARDVLTASGSNNDNPAASYYKVLRNPEDTMENTTHLFLGIRFNCNKCHDHPFERWTQDQYYEMAAFFGRVGLEKDPASGDRKIGGTAVEGATPLFEKVVDKKDGEIKHARTGNVVPPEFPYPVDYKTPEGDDVTRRQQLAQWMTAPDNPYFAKSYVNRLWGYLLGVGLIEPIDDIRAGNPPTNPKLLDHLAQEFVESGFDTRHVLRLICTSRTYQLSVETNQWNEDDTLNYSHALPRRLPAEVIYDAVHRLTGSESDIPGMPKGTRAAALTDSGVKLKDGFLQNLGRPVRESACECERSSDLQLGPIMALIGGPTIASAIADPKNELEKIVEQHADDRELVNEIFLRSLGRLPSEHEFAAFSQIKQQIESDHQLLTEELAAAEAQWKTRRAELESIREQNLAETEQQIVARTEAIKPEREKLAKEREERIAAAKKGVEEATAKLGESVKAWEAKNADDVEWHPLRSAAATATNKAVLTPQPDRSIVASGEKGTGVYTVTYETNLKQITGFRLEALSDPSLPANGPGLPPNGNFVVTEFEIQSASLKEPKKKTAVGIESGKADFLQDGFTAEATFDGQKRGNGGWAVSGATGSDHWITYKLKEPIANEDGVQLTFSLHQFHVAEHHQLGRFRISATTATGDIPLGLSEPLRAAVSVPADKRGEELTKRLTDYVSKTDDGLKKANEKLAAANQPVPADEELTRLEKRRDTLKQPTPDDPRLVRLREDAKFSKEQLDHARLTAAEDLTWALINSPAFLFNH